MYCWVLWPKLSSNHILDSSQAPVIVSFPFSCKESFDTSFYDQVFPNSLHKQVFLSFCASFPCLTLAVVCCSPHSLQQLFVVAATWPHWSFVDDPTILNSWHCVVWFGFVCKCSFCLKMHVATWSSCSLNGDGDQLSCFCKSSYYSRGKGAHCDNSADLDLGLYLKSSLGAFLKSGSQ